MENIAMNALFSRPEDDSRIQLSWKLFQQSGDLPESDLRRIVGESWRRCLTAQVDPGRNQAPIELLEGEVQTLVHLHRELLQAGKPVMSLAKEFLSETGTVMVLADPKGMVLDVEGDSRTLSPAEKIHLLPGAVWNEAHCGTNAIGTALSLEQPVQIHSEEHYCEGIKRWTCSAAVIRHPYTQSVLGVLDVSGLSKTYNRQSLSLVVNSASRIETLLAQKELLLRYRLLDRCIARLSTADGSIILDRHGFAIKLNEHADEALAAVGVQLDLRKAARIEGLRFDEGAGGKESCHLPAWLRPEWIEPIVEQGEHIGSVISLPNRRPTRRGAWRPAVPAESLPLHNFGGAIGSNAEFRAAIAKSVQLAKSRAPVLLLGETGTGKEVFARGIHESSPMSGGPFVALNCGSLSRDLLASELFGYREGAFTGSRRGGMVGKIEAADGGTLFLDELGEMPLDLQPHLLRVLEDGQIFRLGDNTPKKINFRLVAATNRDLRTEVTEGRFRMDLFYRVSVTSLRLPPLRDRLDDIGPLATHFMRQLCVHHGIAEKKFDPEVLAQMECYSWPGNVRELRNMVESMILTAPDDQITLEDLPIEVQPDARLMQSLSGKAGATQQLRALEKAELDQICRALEETSGNATLAAQHLGIAKSTLYVKLKKYGLEAYLESSRH